MPGRAPAVAISILLLALPALPQCNFNPVLSAPFRSSIFDLALDGNDLWAATSYGVSLFDRSVDPPQLVATVAVPGTSRLIRLSNGLAYAGSGSSLAVVRKNGKSLQLVRSIDAGATINDIVVTTLYLYVATSAGIAQYNLLDPTNPTRTVATFSTSVTAVTSLTLIGTTTLYAADGDATIEVFDLSAPTVPRHTGTVGSPTNATTVRSNNGKLYASSTLQTSIFLNGVRLGGTDSVGMTSLAPISGDAVFLSGNDRRLHAIDFTTPGTPINIFETDLPPTSGTVNRINSVITAGGRLYAGAGDIGLLTYDISTFTPPFPVRGYTFDNATSIISLNDKVYVGRTNGITEFSQSASGALTQARSWDGSRADTVQDGEASRGFLLSSSGQSATFWTLISTPPQAIASTTFAAAVNQAVSIGTTGYAVLANRTLRSADFAQASPVPQLISTGTIKPSSIARWGSTIALSDLRDDGTTLVAFYATADFTQAPQTVIIPGIATTAVTLSNGVAAVQTFRGISLIDFGSGTTTVLPQSNNDIARQLVLSGNTLVELTDSTIRVWNTQTKGVAGEVTVPGQPLAMHIAPQSDIADTVTSTGVVTVAVNALARMPAGKSASNGNAYYKKIAGSSNRIYLSDGRRIDVYTGALHYVDSIRSPIVDFAANDAGVFTLSTNLGVASYSIDGIPRAAISLTEGSDAQPLAITAVNGAIWVSLSRGCTGSGNCEKKTDILNAQLGQTVSFSGAVVDLVVNGNRAYVITDLPAEVRVLDISDPLHPATLASRAAEGTPVSISYANGTVYVLGSTLAAYTETGLTKIGDVLGAYASDGVVTYADQHVRIDGNCAVVTGRSFGPQLFTIGSAGQWAPAATFGVGSPVRTLAVKPGTLYFLSDHAVDIWSTSPLPKPPRRAPAR